MSREFAEKSRKSAGLGFEFPNIGPKLSKIPCKCPNNRDFDQERSSLPTASRTNQSHKITDFRLRAFLTMSPSAATGGSGCFWRWRLCGLPQTAGRVMRCAMSRTIPCGRDLVHGRATGVGPAYRRCPIQCAVTGRPTSRLFWSAPRLQRPVAVR